MNFLSSIFGEFDSKTSSAPLLIDSVRFQDPSKMGDKEDFIVASFVYASGKFNIDRGDGTKIKTLDVPNRRWFRACANNEIMVAASCLGTCGACIFTREGDLKQSIETKESIYSCALSQDGRYLILGSGKGLFQSFQFKSCIVL